jgi:hypothetical protein
MAKFPHKQSTLKVKDADKLINKEEVLHPGNNGDLVDGISAELEKEFI